MAIFVEWWRNKLENRYQFKSNRNQVKGSATETYRKNNVFADVDDQRMILSFTLPIFPSFFAFVKKDTVCSFPLRIYPSLSYSIYELTEFLTWTTGFLPKLAKKVYYTGVGLRRVVEFLELTTPVYDANFKRFFSNVPETFHLSLYLYLFLFFSYAFNLLKN